jgi:hypothetical protein
MIEPEIGEIGGIVIGVTAEGLPVVQIYDRERKKYIRFAYKIKVDKDGTIKVIRVLDSYWEKENIVVSFPRVF